MSQLDAFFLPIGQDSRFCILHSPANALKVRGSVLFVHPFAEEMNKSRRVAALQARTLADAGWTVLQVDLFGCGDSTGDFADASWQRWIDDVVQAADWLRGRTTHQPALWALRAGCLVAAWAARNMRPTPDLLLWQPVASGKQFVQQFLRLKVANQIVIQGDGERTGTRQLHEQLVRGEAVEIAGYSFSPPLALGMETAELEPPDMQARIAWFEVCGTQRGELMPASRARIQTWRDAGHRVEAHVIEGAPFWQTQDITECPALIDATIAVLEGWQR